MRVLAAMLVLLAFSAGPALSQGQRCMYANEFFSSGAISCQAGTQFRCVAGAWQRLGLGCADTKAESDEEGLQVDPSRQAPGVGDPAVKQPGPPTVPKN